VHLCAWRHRGLLRAALMLASTTMLTGVLAAQAATNTTGASSSQEPLCEDQAPTPRNELLHSRDLEYMGAFLLPPGEDFAYCKGVKAYNPDGDSEGPNDGYPGSLFGTGHVWYSKAYEVTIPRPVISRNPLDLNTAQVLQQPCELVTGIELSVDDELKGMEYLPAQGAQTTPKLHVSFGRHYQYTRRETHGWTETDLSHPNAKGPWFVGPESMVNDINTNEYIFTIPQDWSDQYVPGMRLACGRHREGQEASGPSIIAYGPWNDGNPPPPHTELSAVPLLLYEKLACLCTGDNPNGHCLRDYCEDDDWLGGAWLHMGDRAAVAIVGIKAFGDCWYGWSDGTRMDDCADWPGGCEAYGYSGDNRGYWADYYETVILLYDPNDLARVARGEMAPCMPQPYETMIITPRMLQPADTYKIKTGGVAYDDERGLLYVTEQYGYLEKYRPVVHVWKIREQVAGGGSGGNDPGTQDPPDPENNGGGDEEAESETDVSSATGPVFVYPNPSRGRTTISFDERIMRQTQSAELRSAAGVTSDAAIYDIRGRRVQDLGPVTNESVVWDGSRLDAGIYFLGVRVGGEFYSKKITIVR
jgi:hypothetical protein